MALSDSPPQRHREVAGAFTDLVLGSRDWEAPAPVAGWVARDVVRHLVDWLPGFLADGADVVLPRGVALDDDPVQAWLVHAGAVQALLDDPATPSLVFAHPRAGRWQLDVAVDRFYTIDVFLHTWDLARATGQDERLDPDLCGELLAGMTPMEDVLRSSGQYGPAVPVPAGADVQSRLLGFIGRDPAWRPPALSV
jgi:uncharacterized protein (TIGR03086 family)